MSDTVTVIRCCPDATRSLCVRCYDRLPKRLRDALVGTYWDGDLIGHAQAADEALTWLKAHHRSGRRDAARDGHGRFAREETGGRI
jgi:hypothetical protein